MYLIEELLIDRVDLVDEGANSSAFIELYKRKEQDTNMDIKEIISKMKPEFGTIVEEAFSAKETEIVKLQTDLATANDAVTKVKEDLTKVTAELEEFKKSNVDTEEEIFKAMPEGPTKAMITKLRTENAAKDLELKKAKDAEIHATAVNKAKELSKIPLETAKLVEILKTCDSTIMDMLVKVNTAMSVVVGEEGSNSDDSEASKSAYAKIEAKAKDIIKRDSVTKAKAIVIAMKENPELYNEYVKGGAN
jgi:hypothetical protein